MPYKSRAQQRLFHHLVSQGKLAPEVAAEYDKSSKGVRLPQHAVRKAFGGEVYAESGARCPACDYPLDQVPMAKDAGEACPRCGFGSAKDVPVRKAQGGEIMDPSMYRARGGGEVTAKPKRRPEWKNGAEYTADSADDFLSAVRSAANAVRAHERDVAERRERESNRTAPDPSIPRNTQGWWQSNRIENWLERPEERTKELARKIQDFAEDEARVRPEYREQWRKNTSGRMGDVKMADQYARGGEVCEHCGSPMAYGGEAARPSMKELYIAKKRPVVDDGQSFAKALKYRRS